MKTSVNANGSLGFFGILGIVFIVLKLCHVIDWSWVWVLSPIWIGLILTIVILAVVAVIALKRH